MKNQYSLEEIHRYAQEIRVTEQEFKDATRRGAADVMAQIRDQLVIMREVLTQMHDSVSKHGAYRPGLLGRWLAAREIRKTIKTITKYVPSPLQEIMLENSPKLHAITDREDRTKLTKSKE